MSIEIKECTVRTKSVNLVRFCADMTGYNKHVRLKRDNTKNANFKHNNVRKQNEIISIIRENKMNDKE